MRQTKKDHAGFSLIELILVIVILGVISVVVGRILFQGFQNFITGTNISNAEWSSLIAIDRMANDIHTIRSATDISTINSSQFVFTDTSGASVTYQLSGSNLLRNSQTLASGVTGFALSYANSSGAVTATASQVRYVTIAISTTFNNVSSSFTTVSATRGMT